MQDSGLDRPVRLPSGREWACIGLVALMLVLYRVWFDFFISHVGGAAFILPVVPVVVAAATLGVPAALITVVVVAWIDRGVALSHPGPGIGPMAGVLSAVAKAMLGVIVGMLRALMLRVGRVNLELERQVAAREAATEALEQNLELHCSLLQSMAEGVGLFDAEDRFLFANRAAERILGADAGTLVGQQLREILRQDGHRDAECPEQDREPLSPVSYDVTLSLDPYRVLLVTETRLEHRRRGSARTLRVFHDLSDRARLEREQRELEIQSQRVHALQGLAVLASGVAHDFNNLLGGVLGNAELAMLLSREQGSPAVRACLEQIRGFAQEAADLSKQMLAYAGRRKVVPQLVDLNQVVRDIVHLLDSVVAPRATVELELDDSLPHFQADRMQLRQVVMNLATNAVESMKSGRGVLTLRTSLEQDFPSSAHTGELNPGPYAVLTVRDSGTGMNQATVNRIFEPFYSTKLAGRGIGLAATLGIVKAHRGAIAVESTEGLGSVFRVAFPTASEVGMVNVETLLSESPPPVSGPTPLLPPEAPRRSEPVWRVGASA